MASSSSASATSATSQIISPQPTAPSPDNNPLPVLSQLSIFQSLASLTMKLNRSNYVNLTSHCDKISL
ncbi:hypothetical protein PanWU01x14_004230 [Parasponia andersonii]|uniref:Uncharacterized protein n=1 Tax=Parasponia andersonii TaxID=3476 RepID=A0A2P5E364_PARAD|nr:hypothetical protein PanWU01x14_004230 [Parasponia andersonii]